MTLPPNPVLPGWHADPEIHRFAGAYWIYPTRSLPYEEQTIFEAWSSPDLQSWTNEGMILDFAEIPWSTNRAAWAPSCAERDGRYYFYFSAGDGAGLGVAVSDAPGGPFRDALGHPLVLEYHHGAQPIDAHAFVDEDGAAYLYWGGWSRAVVAPLGDDMISLAGPIREVTPEQYVEGSFMLRHPDPDFPKPYVFMWSEGGWGDESYGVAYGMAATPYGPFPREGAILSGTSALGSSAGHHSVLRLDEGEYVIAYHRRPAGETAANHRVVCLDRLHFRSDGLIEPVVQS